jgi:hypothetical protein
MIIINPFSFAKPITTTTTTASPLLTGLISYWALEEASGTLYDSVGSNDLNGVYIAPTYHATGKINYGVYFSGTSSAYLYGNLSTGVSAMTFSCWFYSYLDEVVNQTIFNILDMDNWPPSRKPVFIGTDSGSGDPKFTFECLDAVESTKLLQPNLIVVNSTWYHIACTYTIGAPLKMYINNIKYSGSTNMTNHLYQHSSECDLGASYSASAGYCYAILDEVGYWSRALTDSEVSILYNSGNGKGYPFI